MKELIPAIESPDGLFHDGNPLTGELGTIVPAKWLNDMQGATQATQSEILSLLASAGIEASAESSTQLLQALNKRYLQTDNSLSEFKEQNKVDDVLKNLGLGEKFQPKGNYADKSSPQTQIFESGVVSRGDISSGGAIAASSGSDQLSIVINPETHQYDFSQKINGAWLGRVSLPVTSGRIALTDDQFGVNQSWQDETKNRSLSTSFTNTSRKAIMISVSVEQPYGDNAAALTLKVNDKIVGDAVSRYNSGRKAVCLSAVIPPGASYSAQNGGAIGGNLYTWAEMK